MESHHLLSSSQYFYITSQKGKLSETFNKSQDLARIKKKIEQAFETFNLILSSSELTQEQIDEMFPDGKIHDLMMDLIKFNSEDTLAESRIKLLMAQTCLNHGLSYFQQRYSELSFYSDKIEEFKSLINTIHTLADQEAQEEEALKFYKSRGKMKLPPTIEQHETLHIAMCRICWSHYSAESDINAIKGIRHAKHCNYNKNELKRCIEIIPPKISYFN